MVASRYFYDGERDEVMTDVDLYHNWVWSKEEEEYPKFQDYVQACQWYNNGTLEEITGKILDDYLENYENTGKRYRIYYLEDDAKFNMNDASRALVCNVIENCLDSFDDDEYDAIYVYMPEY